MRPSPTSPASRRERPALCLAMTVFAPLGPRPAADERPVGQVLCGFKAAGAGRGSRLPVFFIAVVAIFYYLKLIKAMWLDPSPGATDAPGLEAGCHHVTALFAFPAVLIALIVLDPAAQTAATALALR